jgi:hypothetical protein
MIRTLRKGHRPAYRRRPPYPSSAVAESPPALALASPPKRVHLIFRETTRQLRMLRVGDRWQCGVPTCGNALFLGQITQHAEQHHQPCALCLAAGQAAELAGDKTHYIARAEVTPANAAGRKSGHQQLVDDKAMKVTRGLTSHALGPGVNRTATQNRRSSHLHTCDLASMLLLPAVAGQEKSPAFSPHYVKRLSASNVHALSGLRYSPTQHSSAVNIEFRQHSGDRTAEARRHPRGRPLCVESAWPQDKEGRARYPHSGAHRWRTPEARERRRKGHHKAKPSGARRLPQCVCLRHFADRRRRATGDAPDHRRCGRESRPRLLAFIEQQGIELYFTEKIAPALGMSYGGRIAILSGQSKAEEFSTLVHELAHEMLHKADSRTTTTRVVRETEAEAIAFIVSKAVGLETGTACSDYVVAAVM